MHASYRLNEGSSKHPAAHLKSGPARIDPSVLHAAKAIYQNYCVVHTHKTPCPIGVAIDRTTHRGQLVFNACPILLPQECFIPVQHLQST
ncbi:MAG: hypothetical protein AAF327_10150 [Cyanobacteria bacterium P01_A01_bin.37]